eukprot:1133221-Pelagomonas_calceolata.AAC.8
MERLLCFGELCCEMKAAQSSFPGFELFTCISLGRWVVLYASTVCPVRQYLAGDILTFPLIKSCPFFVHVPHMNISFT